VFIDVSSDFLLPPIIFGFCHSRSTIESRDMSVMTQGVELCKSFNLQKTSNERSTAWFEIAERFEPNTIF